MANGQTKENFYKGVSVLRNKELMEIFRNIDLVEKSGYGVPKIIREYGMDVFKINEGSIFVKIPFNKEVIDFLGSKESHSSAAIEANEFTDKFTDKFTENEKKIIQIIERNNHVKSNELADKLGISRRAVQKNLLKLKEKGILKRVGPDKGGHWEIVEKK